MTGSTLNAIDLQVPNMWTIGSGALANIALNLLLIPYWGNVGAAITTMTSELLVFILGLIQVMWFFHNRRKRVT
jgi:O-antigen/teichoic acid export membrane protein